MHSAIRGRFRDPASQTDWRIFEGTALAPRCREGTVELRNGFIVGIFNHCDRWCQACAFTSRCRLFADMTEMETSLDPGMRDLVETPLAEPHRQPPPWLRELLEELDKAMRGPGVYQPPERPIAQDHVIIEQRARGYCKRMRPWLEISEFAASHDPADPRAVIRWFHALISVRIHRALHGLANDEPADRDWPPDYDGSAKVTLLGIERSQAAWLELVAEGAVTDADAAPLVSDLVWLGQALERVFPNARAFVRPALDEPEAAAELFAGERADSGLPGQKTPPSVTAERRSG